jgi:hypothetical protein
MTNQQNQPNPSQPAAGQPNQAGQPNNTQNSLASRLANRLAGNNQPNAQNAQQAQAANTNTNNNPFNRPAAQRPSSNQQSQTSPPPPQNRFASGQNQRSWTIQPIHKTVVRFDLKGLGDPFYRLLGYPMNPEYGEFKAVTAALEQGGEAVREIEAVLAKSWAQYQLQGAILMYSWNSDAWKTIVAPPAAPAPQEGDDDQSNQTNQTPPPAPINFACLRAIDLALVLNVLARSRSQVLLTRAPAIFAQQYLNRSLMSDDPRLVALAKATGYLEEG